MHQISHANLQYSSVISRKPRAKEIFYTTATLFALLYILQISTSTDNAYFSKISCLTLLQALNKCH
jgi:hypothetical protein